MHARIGDHEVSDLQTELLNEIQWGVYKYLLPEYERSYVFDGGPMGKYHFRYPDEVRLKLPKALYWDLMNWMRRRPIFESFTVTKYLKMRY